LVGNISGQAAPITVSDGSVTVQCTPWDVNCDECANVLDVILIGQHWGETGPPCWIPEDVNCDGEINVLDIIVVGQYFDECWPSVEIPERICNILGVGETIEAVALPPMSFGKLADLVNAIAAAEDEELQTLFDTMVYTKIPNIPAVFKALLQMGVWMLEEAEEYSEGFAVYVQPLFELTPALLAFSETDFTESAEGYGPLGEAVDAIGHAGLSAEWALVEALLAEQDLEKAMARVVQMEGWMMVQMYNFSC
jgi:hypothetical protein